MRRMGWRGAGMTRRRGPKADRRRSRIQGREAKRREGGDGVEGRAGKEWRRRRGRADGDGDGDGDEDEDEDERRASEAETARDGHRKGVDLRRGRLERQLERNSSRRGGGIARK